MVETIVTVILLGLLTIGFTQLALIQNAGEVSVDVQYSMLSADSYFASLYTDYRNAVSYNISESPAGIVSLILVDKDGDSTIYSYNPATQSCSIDGIHQFEASRYEIECSGSNLLITAKVNGEEIMDLCIYK